MHISAARLQLPDCIIQAVAVNKLQLPSVIATLLVQIRKNGPPLKNIRPAYLDEYVNCFFFLLVKVTFAVSIEIVISWG